MISCGNCKGRHATVAEVRACCGAPAGGVLVAEREDEPTSYAETGVFNPAGAPTQKQLDYLRILLNERECSDRERSVWEGYLDSPTASQTKYGVSTAIERLRSYPRRQRAAAPAAGITEDGMYRLDGTIFKVQFAVHGSGQLYAKRLHLNPSGVGASFIYDSGAVRRLRPEHRLTLEEAKEFGKLYGVCCQCGRTLTDETSIEAGIGPVCAGKI